MSAPRVSESRIQFRILKLASGTCARTAYSSNTLRACQLRGITPVRFTTDACRECLITKSPESLCHLKLKPISAPPGTLWVGPPVRCCWEKGAAERCSAHCAIVRYKRRPTTDTDRPTCGQQLPAGIRGLREWRRNVNAQVPTNIYRDRLMMLLSTLKLGSPKNLRVQRRLYQHCDQFKVETPSLAKGQMYMKLWRS